MKNPVKQFRFQDGPWSGKAAILSESLYVTFTFKCGRFEGRYVRKEPNYNSPWFYWQPRHIISND